jgi:hypothetical protein
LRGFQRRDGDADAHPSVPSTVVLRAGTDAFVRRGCRRVWPERNPLLRPLHNTAARHRQLRRRRQLRAGSSRHPASVADKEQAHIQVQIQVRRT